MASPVELEAVIEELLRSSEPGGEVSLDRVGEAIGTMAVSVDEIETVLTALESAGRSVVGTEGTDPKADLRDVMSAARSLRDGGVAPTIPELARRTGMSEARVRTALLLGQVIGR